jgi:glycosyltransferase involved in cell wall biosynthesis
MSEPTVTIALPTYNNERWMAITLDSLLAQDFADFDVHVWDDASTDRTADIVADYVKRDRRVHLHRRTQNVGALANYNQAVRESPPGELLVQGGDHDVYHPKFLSACLAVLRSDPAVVLAYTLTEEIDAEGASLGIMPDRMDTRGLDAYARHSRFIWQVGLCNMISGVMRREAVIKTAPFLPTVACDETFLAELAFHGAFAQIQESLFFRRMVRPPETVEERVRRQVRVLNLSESRCGRTSEMDRVFKAWAGAHFRVILRTPALSPIEKARAIVSTLACFRVRRKVWWRGLSRLEMWLTQRQQRRRGAVV